MSIVTSIIITFPYSENELDRVAEINTFEHAGRKYHFQWIDQHTNPDNDSTCYSGNKVFNSVVMLASYNNFPIDPFLNYLSEKINWLDSEAVQVFVKSEAGNDKTFRVYSHAGKVLVSDSIKE